MELPWLTTVPFNVLIALAFAARPVVPFVIEAFKVVIFTEVEISALSLTPATKRRSLAF